MKVFRYVSSIPRHVDLPVGKRVTQCSLVVAAPTKKRAIELFAATGVDCTPYLLNTYGSGTANPDDVRTAMERPELVFARPLADTDLYVPVMSVAEQEALEQRAREEQENLRDCDDYPEDGLELLLRSADNSKPVGWVGPEHYDLRDQICGYPV